MGLGAQGGISGSQLGVDGQVVTVTQESCSGDVRLNTLQGDINFPRDPKNRIVR